LHQYSGGMVLRPVGFSVVEMILAVGALTAVANGSSSLIGRGGTDTETIAELQMVDLEQCRGDWRAGRGQCHGTAGNHGGGTNDRSRGSEGENLGEKGT
jgi:hypothetical protein